MAVPYPGLWNQASQLAQDQMGAQMGAFSRSSHRETKRGQRYIRRLAHSFADELGNIGAGVGRGFDQAAAQQQASDAAIANFLQGGGEQMSSDISNQLSFSPEAAKAQGGMLERVGQAGGAMAAGFGGANMQNVLGEKASNQAYAKMLPGIAALSGIQEAGAFQQQQAADLKDQRDQLMGQIPGVTANLYSAFAQQRAAQAQMAQAERFHHDEMQASASQAAMDNQGNNKVRVDQADNDAYSMLSNLLQPDLTGKSHPYSFDDLQARVAEIYKRRFPGRSDSWAMQQAASVVHQFGVIDTSGLQNAIADVGSMNPLANFTHRTTAQGASTFPTGASAPGSLTAPGQPKGWWMGQ